MPLRSGLHRTPWWLEIWSGKDPACWGTSVEGVTHPKVVVCLGI
jgi:hypothetical protein